MFSLVALSLAPAPVVGVSALGPIPEAGMKCPRCQQENLPQAKFCLDPANTSHFS
jgi:hypothetical protein